MKTTRKRSAAAASTIDDHHSDKKQATAIGVPSMWYLPTDATINMTEWLLICEVAMISMTCKGMHAYIRDDVVPSMAMINSKGILTDDIRGGFLSKCKNVKALNLFALSKSKSVFLVTPLCGLIKANAASLEHVMIDYQLHSRAKKTGSILLDQVMHELYSCKQLRSLDIRPHDDNVEKTITKGAMAGNWPQLVYCGKAANIGRWCHRKQTLRPAGNDNDDDDDDDEDDENETINWAPSKLDNSKIKVLNRLNHIEMVWPDLKSLSEILTHTTSIRSLDLSEGKVNDFMHHMPRFLGLFIGLVPADRRSTNISRNICPVLSNVPQLVNLRELHVRMQNSTRITDFWEDATIEWNLPSLETLMIQNINGVLPIIKCPELKMLCVRVWVMNLVNEDVINGHLARSLGVCRKLEHLTVDNSFLDKHGMVFNAPYPHLPQLRHFTVMYRQTVEYPAESMRHIRAMLRAYSSSLEYVSVSRLPVELSFELVACLPKLQQLKGLRGVQVSITPPSLFFMNLMSTSLIRLDVPAMAWKTIKHCVGNIRIPSLSVLTICTQRNNTDDYKDATGHDFSMLEFIANFPSVEHLIVTWPSITQPNRGQFVVGGSESKLNEPLVNVDLPKLKTLQIHTVVGDELAHVGDLLRLTRSSKVLEHMALYDINDDFIKQLTVSLRDDDCGESKSWSNLHALSLPCGRTRVSEVVHDLVIVLHKLTGGFVLRTCHHAIDLCEMKWKSHREMVCMGRTRKTSCYQQGDELTPETKKLHQKLQHDVWLRSTERSMPIRDTVLMRYL